MQGGPQERRNLLQGRNQIQVVHESLEVVKFYPISYRAGMSTPSYESDKRQAFIIQRLYGNYRGSLTEFVESTDLGSGRDS